MKKILFLIALPCILVFFSTCKKIEITTKVTTVSVTPGKTSATAVGNILDLSNNSHSDYGFCYGTNNAPTIADGKKVLGVPKFGSFTGTIEGLTSGQKYYIRAYCNDGNEYIYGESKEVTPDATMVPDNDGNYYHIVTIGTQTWMKENLRTTKYRDGSSINNMVSNSEWPVQTDGAYCWYNNDDKYKDNYGALYNWYATVDSRNLCPIGWHVPSNTEWDELITYLGGEVIAGKKLKSTTLWDSPNNADNSSEFAALPGGYRARWTAEFGGIGWVGYWWSSKEYTLSNSLFYNLTANSSNISRHDAYKQFGMSVRCIKD